VGAGAEATGMSIMGRDGALVGRVSGCVAGGVTANTFGKRAGATDRLFHHAATINPTAATTATPMATFPMACFDASRIGRPFACRKHRPH